MHVRYVRPMLKRLFSGSCSGYVRYPRCDRYYIVSRPSRDCRSQCQIFIFISARPVQLSRSAFLARIACFPSRANHRVHFTSRRWRPQIRIRLVSCYPSPSSSHVRLFLVPTSVLHRVFVFPGPVSAILSVLPRNDSRTGCSWRGLSRHIETRLRIFTPSDCLVVGVQREMRGARVTSRGGTRGANVRTTCVGGSVLLSFTLAKSQSRPTPTASHPSHPSRSSGNPLAAPFFHPSRIRTVPSLAFSLPLAPSLISSFLLLFFSSPRLKRVCASTRFIEALHAPSFRFSATNNNARDNFFRDIVGFIPLAVSFERVFKG